MKKDNRKRKRKKRKRWRRLSSTRKRTEENKRQVGGLEVAKGHWKFPGKVTLILFSFSFPHPSDVFVFLFLFHYVGLIGPGGLGQGEPGEEGGGEDEGGGEGARPSYLPSSLHLPLPLVDFNIIPSLSIFSITYFPPSPHPLPPSPLSVVDVCISFVRPYLPLSGWRLLSASSCPIL